MTLRHIIPGLSFTDTSIVKLYRDIIANDGTLDIFDALDAYSWAKQGDPTEGSDTWKSLIGTSPNTASFGGSVGWSSGFTTNATDVDVITLPDTFRPSGTASRCMIFWMKPGTQTETGSVPVFGWWKTGTGDSPYFAYWASAGDAMNFSQGNGGTQIIASHVRPTTVQQYAFSLQPIGAGGVYVTKFFRNGVLVNTITGTATSLTLSGRNAELAGPAGFNKKFVATYYRAVADDLSVTTPEALVALDYLKYSARFS
jgi:hypothetical protein